MGAPRTKINYGKGTLVEEQPITQTPITAQPQTATIDLSRLTVNYVVVAVIFLAIGLLLGRLLFAGGVGGSLDEAQLRALISEAVAQSGGGANSYDTLAGDNNPVLGPEDAAVTIVEFADFNCGWCGRFVDETLYKIVETYGDNVRIVYRDMPIIGGQTSVDAAIAAECAASQDRFWDYHNLLFKNTEARGRDAYVGFAEEIGLNIEQYTLCLDDKATSDAVLLDYLDGQGLSITGTPAFFINGRKISGGQPFEVFSTIIEAELRKKGITTTPDAA